MDRQTAERNLIAAILLDETCFDAAQDIPPHKFQDEGHREVFKAIVECGIFNTIDVVNVCETMRDNGSFNAEVPQFLKDLLDESDAKTDAASIDAYIAVITAKPDAVANQGDINTAPLSSE